MPRLLDLCCGAGGASLGYVRAGFDVVGVDICEQRRYPFKFFHSDAMRFLKEHGKEFSAIHVSPPCQGYSKMKNLNKGKKYPLLIGKFRDILMEIGRPYVIENVVGAPLFRSTDLFGNHGVVLCGSMFGLGVWRHRIFETSFAVTQPRCRHNLVPYPMDVSGTGGPRGKKKRVDSAGGESRKPRSMSEASRAMGIRWMTRREINQAVPPAYTEYVGKAMLVSIYSLG